jgi:hypothetical protein
MRPSSMDVAGKDSIRGGRTPRGVDALVQALSVVVAVPPPVELHGALVCSTVALILVQTFPVSSNLSCELTKQHRYPTADTRPPARAAAGLAHADGP